MTRHARFGDIRRVRLARERDMRENATGSDAQSRQSSPAVHAVPPGHHGGPVPSSARHSRRAASCLPVVRAAAPPTAVFGEPERPRPRAFSLDREPDACEPRTFFEQVAICSGTPYRTRSLRFFLLYLSLLHTRGATAATDERPNTETSLGVLHHCAITLHLGLVVPQALEVVVVQRRGGNLSPPSLVARCSATTAPAGPGYARRVLLRFDRRASRVIVSHTQVVHQPRPVVIERLDSSYEVHRRRRAAPPSRPTNATSATKCSSTQASVVEISSARVSPSAHVAVEVHQSSLQKRGDLRDARRVHLVPAAHRAQNAPLAAHRLRVGREEARPRIAHEREEGVVGEHVGVV